MKTAEMEIRNYLEKQSTMQIRGHVQLGVTSILGPNELHKRYSHNENSLVRQN